MKPHQKQLELEPARREHAPFEVIVKSQELAYGIRQVLTDRIPRLLHGNDGLIFTSAEAVYTPGTDRKILKWKPPSENSIDFRLQLKFPACQDDPARPDFAAKPAFLLLMNHGREGSHYYDVLEVDDAMWEEWKARGEQYDDRVVEVTWDKERERWLFMRFRDDKREGNYKTVVENIVKSIQHGVEADTVSSPGSSSLIPAEIWLRLTVAVLVWALVAGRALGPDSGRVEGEAGQAGGPPEAAAAAPAARWAATGRGVGRVRRRWRSRT